MILLTSRYDQRLMETVWGFSLLVETGRLSETKDKLF